MDLIPSSLSDFCLESYFVKISTRSRVVYWVIIGIISFAIISLPFIYIDVSVQARGYFQSHLERQTILTAYQGKVIFVNLKSATKVNKGDTLLMIDFESIKAKALAIQNRQKEVNESIHDLEVLTASDNIKSIDRTFLINNRYIAEYEELGSRTNIREQIYLKKKSEHERNQLLFNQRIIPQTEYENSLFMVDSEKEYLDQVIISQKLIWQNDLISRKNELERLNADLGLCKEELTNRIVVAPLGGEIVQSMDIQVGSTINAGQKIAEISPDGNLIAVCFVTPADIGLLHNGQKVRIQVDAFNYNEWGLIDAEIIEISDDMVIENGTTALFRIKCRPDQTYLQLKNGYQANIRKGMSLNARIFVIRRSLFNLLYDKAARWFNPYDYKSQ